MYNVNIAFRCSIGGILERSQQRELTGYYLCSQMMMAWLSGS